VELASCVFHKSHMNWLDSKPKSKSYFKIISVNSCAKSLHDEGLDAWLGTSVNNIVVI
jgi:hypothetical protein